MLLPSLHDPKQVLRLKRTLLAIAGGGLHTVLCWIFLEWNFFRATVQQFIYLFGLFWLVHLIFPLLILLGVNKRFKDPSLTFPQMAWATICAMITIYYIYDLRMVILMYYPLVMVFGAFRLHLNQFLIISTMAIIGYGLAIVFMEHNQVEILNLRAEFIRWLCFSVVVTAFAFMGANLSALRRQHRKQSRLLSEAMEQIKHLVVTDELTGLWNRRYIMKVLKTQKALAERGGYSFSVCFIDLDHFKKVNDLYGHQGGDLVLQKASQEMSGRLREIDFLARFGGEEFLAVLAQASEAAALAAGQRLLEQVRRIEFGGELAGLRITVSLGVAVFIPGESVDGFINRADQAMYQAKKLGRDQLVLAGREQPTSGPI
ncbi:MAG: GGDEF domain-containing protein [Proteobacteria bacterium]|nr:GGDEF domain-containing protein [Pseudomonadota bacterium]MBU1452150.1 GGDEF domain-containing protein [Pseudomonadota bacterium]MBU2467545.1 GGDEF domain-containing protein [Pseudomonadota bacterium]MBU2518082.1 GGDEF domain-containing protein [Pseudomonadota bacterium]